MITLNRYNRPGTRYDRYGKVDMCTHLKGILEEVINGIIYS